jgi:hypothetical protein
MSRKVTGTAARPIRPQAQNAHWKPLVSAAAGRCPGVEHQRPGAVLIEELSGGHRVGRIGHDGGEAAAQQFAQFLQPGAVTGDPDDVRAGLRQRDGDAAAKTPAGAGDQRRRT